MFKYSTCLRNPWLALSSTWFCSSDTWQQKKRRISASKVWDVDLEQEEHSLSLSQHSSPTQSDQEHNNPAQKVSSCTAGSQRCLVFKQINPVPNKSHQDPRVPKDFKQRNPQGFHYIKQHHHVYEAEHMPMVRAGPIQQHLVWYFSELVFLFLLVII